MICYYYYHHPEKSSKNNNNLLLSAALFAVLTLIIITLSLVTAVTQQAALADPPNPDKETICHAPPGNPENQHTITVGASSALKGHSKHSDHFGPCPP
jgi:hypothetical protein